MTYIQPLTLIFFAAIFVGLIRLRRCKRVMLPAMAAFTFLLLCWPPVDWLLSRPLEAEYPMNALPAGKAEAIVVLGSSVSPPQGGRPYAVADRDTYRRSEHAAWLYRHWQPLPVLACGGSQSKNQQPVARVMRELLLRAGVPDSMIWTEEWSRSTYENAFYGADVLRKRGIKTIALIVEAYAMPRAERVFRRQGFNVVPAPSSFRELGSVQDELIPTWKAIERNENTLHEAVGLAWYGLRGWI